MKKWYSIGDNKTLECCNCSSLLSNVGELDHHPRQCPICKVESVFYDYDSRMIQILYAEAPLSFRKFIIWAQTELDELEFVELLCTFEELAKESKHN